MEDYIVVFLDDSPERAATLHQRMPAKDVSRTIWVRTVEETLDLLINYRDRLRDVWLDHDLGGTEFMHSGSEECGMEIVRWLEKQNPEDYKHVKFIIHSWNLSAGMKMTDRLNAKGYKAVRKPFGM